MGIGSQVASATITGSGKYCRPGRFKGRISGVQEFTGQDGIQNIAVEFTVLEFAPGVDGAGLAVPAEAHAVGSTATYFNKLKPGPALKSILGNVKAFCLAVFKQQAENVRAQGGDAPKAGEIKESDLDPKFIDEAIICNNSRAVGLELDFEVFEVKNKTNGNYTSRYKWFVRTAEGQVVSA